MNVRLIAIKDFDLFGYRAVSGQVLAIPQEIAARLVEAENASYYSQFTEEVSDRNSLQSRIIAPPSIEARIDRTSKIRRGGRGANS
jgi:hypothetical protein